MILKRLLPAAVLFGALAHPAAACGYVRCPTCLLAPGSWSTILATVNGVPRNVPPVVPMIDTLSTNFMLSMNTVVPKGACVTTNVGTPVTPNTFTSTTTCAGILRSQTTGVMVPMFPVFNPLCPHIQPWVSFGNPAISLTQTTTVFNPPAPPTVTMHSFKWIM